MPTLIVGVLIVAVSAAGFAFTMFGRRALPQPAMVVTGRRPAAVTAAREPARGRGRVRSVERDDASAPRLQVDVPAAVRIRSAFLLALGVIATAAIVGVALSVVIVGAFTLIG